METQTDFPVARQISLSLKKGGGVWRNELLLDLDYIYR